MTCAIPTLSVAGSTARLATIIAGAHHRHRRSLQVHRRRTRHRRRRHRRIFHQLRRARQTHRRPRFHHRHPRCRPGIRHHRRLHHRHHHHHASRSPQPHLHPHRVRPLRLHHQLHRNQIRHRLVRRPHRRRRRHRPHRRHRSHHPVFHRLRGCRSKSRTKLRACRNCVQTVASRLPFDGSIHLTSHPPRSPSTPFSSARARATAELSQPI